MISPHLKKVHYVGPVQNYFFQFEDSPEMAYTEEDVASLRQKGDLTSIVIADSIQRQIDAFKRELPNEMRRVYDVGKTSRKWREKSQEDFCVGLFSDHPRATPLVGSYRLVGRHNVEIADEDGDGKVDATTFRAADGVWVMIMAMRAEHHLKEGECDVIDTTRQGVERYLRILDGLTCLGCNLD